MQAHFSRKWVGARKKVRYCPKEVKWLSEQSKKDPHSKNQHGLTWREELERRLQQGSQGIPSFPCVPDPSNPLCKACRNKPEDFSEHYGFDELGTQVCGGRTPVNPGREAAKAVEKALTPAGRDKTETRRRPRTRRASVRRCPPPYVQVTLRNFEAENGILRVTPGLEIMIRFYQWSESIVFATYGQTRVTATRKGRYLQSSDLARWFSENALKERDVLRIEAPRTSKELPRLYAVHGAVEEEWTAEHESESERETYGQPLRDFVYHELSKSEVYLSAAGIARRLQRDVHKGIDDAVVLRCLRANPHLFAPREGCSTFWGLSAWTSGLRPRGVDKQSLVFAIADRDLVYECLRERNEPASTAEIAEWIAGYFRIPAGEVKSTSFLSPSDSRLIRLTDGRWGLAEWIEQWKRGLELCQRRLDEWSKITKRLAVLRSQEDRIGASLLALRRSIFARLSAGSLPWFYRFFIRLGMLLAPRLRRRSARVCQEIAGLERKLSAVQKAMRADEESLRSVDNEQLTRQRDRLVALLSSIVESP